MDRVGHGNAKRVEADVELGVVLSMDAGQICWVLMESMLRVLVLVKDLRSEGLICR